MKGYVGDDHTSWFAWVSPNFWLLYWCNDYTPPFTLKSILVWTVNYMVTHVILRYMCHHSPHFQPYRLLNYQGTHSSWSLDLSTEYYWKYHSRQSRRLEFDLHMPAMLWAREVANWQLTGYIWITFVFCLAHTGFLKILSQYMLSHHEI